MLFFPFFTSPLCSVSAVSVLMSVCVGFSCPCSFLETVLDFHL